MDPDPGSKKSAEITRNSLKNRHKSPDYHIFENININNKLIQSTLSNFIEHYNFRFNPYLMRIFYSIKGGIINILMILFVCLFFVNLIFSLKALFFSKDVMKMASRRGAVHR